MVHLRPILHLFAASSKSGFSTGRRLGALTTKRFATKANLLEGAELRHDYYALRHGQSLANVAGLIQSNPKIACDEYGLSEQGWSQARLAGTDVVSRAPERLVILMSDLKRARETAHAVLEAVTDKGLNAEHYIEKGLRERWFGDWDGTSDDNYNLVWENDKVNANHTIAGVESVNSVMTRATQVVLDWDEKLGSDKAMVICVAHGDVLQILQTAFRGLDGSAHRSLDHLETAQLRRLTGTI